MATNEAQSRHIALRAARIEDIPALSQLGRSSFADKFGYLYRSEDLAAFLEQTHAHGVLAREIADPRRRYRLAEADGVLAGYCKLAVPSTLAGHGDHRRPVEIKQLYTAAGMTGLGIGARLMDWALAQARSHGADAVQLSVWSGNEGAQRFYARYGFARTADIHFWVGTQRDDEFLFTLDL